MPAGAPSCGSAAVSTNSKTSTMTALELIKARHPGAESLILIIDDPKAQRVVAAWPTLGPRMIDRPLKRRESFEHAAESLWQKAHDSFSMEDLADQADVAATRCERIFARLIRAGIVYPDGTISQEARDLLAGQVRAHIKGLIPKGKTAR